VNNEITTVFERCLLHKCLLLYTLTTAILLQADRREYASTYAKDYSKTANTVEDSRDNFWSSYFIPAVLAISFALAYKFFFA